MNKFHWVKYLVYMVLIYLLLALRGYVATLIQQGFQMTYQANIAYLVIVIFIGIPIGMILGTEHLLKEKKKKGKWKINYPRLLIMGLPSLLLSVTPVLAFSNLNLLGRAAMTITLPLRDSSGISLFQLILGYVLVTSVYKIADTKVEALDEGGPV